MACQVQRDGRSRNNNCNNMPGMRLPGGGTGRRFERHARSVERVIRAMTGRLDRPMTNEEMAEIACFSPYHFNRIFRGLTGIPPIQFHYALRLERAKRLLATTDLGVTDICFEVGYNSLGTFVYSLQ